MAGKRTDSYQLTVIKPDGGRASFAGSKKEMELLADNYRKHIRGAQTEITKRK